MSVGTIRSDAGDARKSSRGRDVPVRGIDFSRIAVVAEDEASCSLEVAGYGSFAIKEGVAVNFQGTCNEEIIGCVELGGIAGAPCAEAGVRYRCVSPHLECIASQKIRSACRALDFKLCGRVGRADAETIGIALDDGVAEGDIGIIEGDGLGVTGY